MLLWRPQGEIRPWEGESLTFLQPLELPETSTAATMGLQERCQITQQGSQLPGATQLFSDLLNSHSHSTATNNMTRAKYEDLVQPAASCIWIATYSWNKSMESFSLGRTLSRSVGINERQFLPSGSCQANLLIHLIVLFCETVNFSPLGIFPSLASPPSGASQSQSTSCLHMLFLE